MKKIFVLVMATITIWFLSTPGTYAISNIVVDELTNTNIVTNKLKVNGTADGKTFKVGIIDNFYRVEFGRTSNPASDTQIVKRFYMGRVSDYYMINNQTSITMAVQGDFEGAVAVGFNVQGARGHAYTALYGFGLVNDTYTNATESLTAFKPHSGETIQIGGKNIYTTGYKEDSDNVTRDVDRTKKEAALALYCDYIEGVVNIQQKELLWWGHGTPWDAQNTHIYVMYNFQYGLLYRD